MTAQREAIGAAMTLAGRQHGALSTQQLRECGVTARGQRAAVADGLFVAVASTVVVVTGSADTWYRRLRIGLLALGPGACVSHDAAAQLLGIEHETVDAVEFTVLRGRRGATVPDATVHTTRGFGRTDVITVEGFRCTSATRTVLDLAGSGARESHVAAVIDSAIRLRLSASVVLEQRLSELRGPGRRGVRLLDELLVDTGGESVLERRFLRLIREHSLPRPLTQRRIRRGSGQVARVDFLYEAEHIVVEVSGRLGHASDAERTKDAQRRNELQDLGYFVCEYTWGDVTRRPGYVVTTLRERLLLRSVS